MIFNQLNTLNFISRDINLIYISLSQCIDINEESLLIFISNCKYLKSINKKSDFIHMYDYGGNYYDYMRSLLYGKTHGVAMNLMKIRYYF